jgi:LytS/YehU family sensor histidine kinase
MEDKCFHEVAGFNDRALMLVGIPLAAMIVSLLLFNEQFVEGNWSFLIICFPMSLVYTGIFWVLMRLTYKRAKMRFPGADELWKRVLVAFGAFLVVFAVVNRALDALFMLILPGDKAEPNVVLEFLSSLLLTALLITLYEAISFYLQLQRAVAEKVELERRNLESQLEGLRNQVNPHFLFNSLNTLVYLIPGEPDKAVRFVQQLSKVYRYVLESREARVIPLQEELDFLSSYIFLLKERFGDNLQITLSGLQDGMTANAHIVPLTLQMLFENAIKHNIISVQRPLRIDVFAENNLLAVRNNLQRKNQVMDSTGVGLENIRARYRMLGDKEIEVIVSQEYFTVLLPLEMQAVAV